MLQELAMYSSIIVALAMVNVVWQLEKASRLLRTMSLLLSESLDERR